MPVRNAGSNGAGLKERLLSQRALNIICLLSVILIPGIWALLTYDKLAMTSEGWFAVYAKMILAGEMPYRDFELVLPPLYTYINVLIISVFGEGLLAFRVLGVLLFIGLAVLSYFIFKQIFPSWIAAIAALVAIFTLQSEAAHVAYDYIRFYDLFNYLAFFLLLRLFIRSYKKEPVNMKMHLFLAGVSCALAAFFRQTSGIMVFVFFAVFLVLIFLFVKKIEIRGRNLCYFFLGVFVPVIIMAALLVLAGVFTSFIEMTFFAGTKGSMATMLFSWIPRSFEKYTDALWILTVAMALFFVIRFALKRADKDPAEGIFNHVFCCIFMASAAVLVVVLFYSLSFSSAILSEWYPLLAIIFVICFILGLIPSFGVVAKIRKKEQISHPEAAYLFFCGLAAASIVALIISLKFPLTLLMYGYPLSTLLFVLNFILGLIILFKIVTKIRKKDDISHIEATYLFFCGFIFVVGYGSGTSGGLSFGQAALNFGFIAAVILAEINKISETKLRSCFKVAAASLIVILLATTVSSKVVTPYYWWGMTAENYSAAVYETEIDYFRGIKLTADEKFVYEDFVAMAGTHLGDDDELYCYAQIVMFYLLADKVPNVKAPVPWFDVATDRTILDDLEYLQNNNPKMIIFADHGYAALDVHEELFRGGKESGQRAMYEWLLDLKNDPSNGYTVVPNAKDPGYAATYRLHNIDIYLLIRS